MQWEIEETLENKCKAMRESVTLKVEERVV